MNIYGSYVTMKRKVLIIPFTRSRPSAKVRFLVVQDAASGDWTFMSGTCEPGESPLQCALRELCEETKGTLVLRKLPKRTRRFRIYYREGSSGQKQRYDVFFIPFTRISSYTEMKRIENTFDTIPALRREEQENTRIRFETLAQFKRRRNIWTFISWLMNEPSFLRIVPS